MAQGVPKKLIDLAEKEGNNADLVLFDYINELEQKIEKLKEDIDSISKEIKKEPPNDAKVEKIASRLAAKMSVTALDMMPNDSQLRKLIEPMIPPAEEVDYEKIASQVLTMIPKPEMPDMTPLQDKMDEMMETIQEEIVSMKDDIKEAKNTKVSTNVMYGGRILRAATFSFTGDGGTTKFYLPKEPAMKGLGLFAHYQGQWLQKGVHYTVKGKEFDTAGGSAPFTAELSTIIEGFVILF